MPGQRDGQNAYISAPALIFDRSIPSAQTDGQELGDGGCFWSGLSFAVVDQISVSVTDNGVPLPRGNGGYAILPDAAGRTEEEDPRHTLVITDACGNQRSYSLRVLRNELEMVHPLPEQGPFANGTALSAMLPVSAKIETTQSKRAGETVSVPIRWDTENAEYQQTLKSAQDVTVFGTIVLPEGVTARDEMALCVQIALEILEAPKYPVRIEAENGTVMLLNAAEPNAPEFYAGDEVRFTVTAAQGYTLKNVMVNGRRLAPKDGQYRFAQPEGGALIRAEFRKFTQPEPGEGGEPETPEKPKPNFPDVRPDDWFHDDVSEAAERGLLQGTESGFAPHSPVSRAMVWTVLARMEGVQTAPASPWYALAREWAMAEGITDGTRPNDAVTREELAALLYRYEKRSGGGFVGSWYFPLQFTDAASISAYADEAVHWCVMKGILTGFPDGRLAPAGTATRAEFAAILCRFLRLKEG